MENPLKTAYSANRVSVKGARIALDLVFHPVTGRRVESDDVVTLQIAINDAGKDTVLSGKNSPGQFNMIYVFGVGEVPISISGDSQNSDTLVHTIRGVGPVSNALLRIRPGELIGLRGPYGRGWPLVESRNKDLVLIAGGIGLAPLRPVMYHVMHHRKDYGQVALLYGARCPAEQIFRDELEAWSEMHGIQVLSIVDHADATWRGSVGVVTRLIEQIEFDVSHALAMICGPDIMFRYAAMALEELGMQKQQIYLSMERNMQCAIGSCGHCQFGAQFVCKDGPVFALSEVADLLGIREL